MNKWVMCNVLVKEIETGKTWKEGVGGGWMLQGDITEEGALFEVMGDTATMIEQGIAAGIIWFEEAGNPHKGFAIPVALLNRLFFVFNAYIEERKD